MGRPAGINLNVARLMTHGSHSVPGIKPTHSLLSIGVDRLCHALRATRTLSFRALSIAASYFISRWQTRHWATLLPEQPQLRQRFP